MGRLFWKIFVAFWLALMLIAAGAALATSTLARTWHERAVARRELLETLADDAEILLSDGGRQELAAWLRDVTRQEGDYFYALDTDGRDILGRRLPKPLDKMNRGGRFPLRAPRRAL